MRRTWTWDVKITERFKDRDGDFQYLEEWKFFGIAIIPYYIKRPICIYKTYYDGSPYWAISFWGFTISIGKATQWELE